MELINLADPKTNYATEDEVNVLLEGLRSTTGGGVSDTLMAAALADADAYIEEEVGVQDKQNTPTSVEGAAKYKTAALIYRQLYKNSEGSNPTAIFYEAEATRKLNAFVKGGAEETPQKAYTHSNSSNNWYTERQQNGYRRYR